MVCYAGRHYNDGQIHYLSMIGMYESNPPLPVRFGRLTGMAFRLRGNFRNVFLSLSVLGAIKWFCHLTGVGQFFRYLKGKGYKIQVR
jgi:hypothetical protein